MTRLPVSGQPSPLRQPNGADELALSEAPGAPISRALALLTRLNADVDWPSLTVTDVEAALLRLRAQLFGERLDIGFACPGCAERVETAFTVEDFLDDAAPSDVADVSEAPGRAGWLTIGDVLFRLPTAGDQAQVVGRPDAEARLRERCLDPPEPDAETLARAEEAIAALAPEISRDLSGRCPSCGSDVEAPFYVPAFVLGEMLRESGRLLDEVDLIARAYHWREGDILDLPRARRRAYADRIRKAA